MSELRQIQATFRASELATDGEASGVILEFEPLRAKLEVATIRDFAELGPTLTVPAVAGLGKVLRILRGARVAVEADPNAWVGRDAEIHTLLQRARGVRYRLSLRRRARISFTAWTEGGVETVQDVVEVVENDTDYVVLRVGSRAPVRFPRAGVSRQQTQRERWYEILGIERP